MIPRFTENSRVRLTPAWLAVGLAVGLGAFALPSSLFAQPLGGDNVLILGVGMELSPATITAPKGAPIELGVSIVDGAGSDVSSQFPGHVIRGELSGPDIPGGNQLVETVPGETLQIGTDQDAAPTGVVPGPVLGVDGNYLLENIRLVDGNGDTVLTGTPPVVPIKILDRVTVQSIETRKLSIDEIRDRGIVIDEDSFTAFRFSVGIETLSKGVPIELDVVFPQDEELIEGGGPLGLLPILPGLDTPSLDIQGLMLEGETLNFGVEIPPIPAVLVIPGNVAFLNEFFEVILLVSNVAPQGSQIVITSATATLELPFGNDGSPASGDEPLVPAETEDLPHGATSTALVNTDGGAAQFGPGEDAGGEFLVEGKLVGTHRLKVAITADLTFPGAAQPVELSGSAFGTVVVRDRSVALTIHHPEVVRAGEAYTLGITVSNTSETSIELLKLRLDPALVTGATVIDHDHKPTPVGLPGEAEVEDLGVGESQTVSYQLVARQSGRVTAAAFQGEGGVQAGGFQLRTGVGDGNIPLSPDTILLPSYAYELPDAFVAEALRVLGLAHSAAMAPAGHEPDIGGGVRKQMIQLRGQQLALAGLRNRIGEPTHASLLELWLDWLGSYSDGSKVDTGGAQGAVTVTGAEGFDEVRRLTGAGIDLEQALTAELSLLGTGPGAQDLAALTEEFATAGSYRGDFVAISATGDASISIGPVEHATRGCAGAADTPRCPEAAIERNVPNTSIHGFDDGLLSGELAVIGPDQQGDIAPHTVTVTGSGSTALTVVAPNDGILRKFEFSFDLSSCSPSFSVNSTLVGSLDLGCAGSDGGTSYPNTAPAIDGVRQIPESDPLERGRVVGVLFDEAIDGASLAEGVATFALSYAAGQEDVDAVGEVDNQKRVAKLLPGNRIALVGFLSSVSRFFDYELALDGVTDLTGNPVADSQVPVVRDFPRPPGGIVQGTVRDGNGDPLPFAPVELAEYFLDDFFGTEVQINTGMVNTDGDGYYRFDFVGISPFGPYRVRARHPETGKTAERYARISVEGQEQNVDLLMLGSGRVEGTIFDVTGGAPGVPVVGAEIAVDSLTDGTTQRARSGAGGAYSVDNVSVGDVLVRASYDVPNTAEKRKGAVAASLAAAGQVISVDVDLFSGTSVIEGTVFEQSSDTNAVTRLVPVGRNVQVALVNDDVGYADDVFTDSQGRFRFPAVPPGAVRIRAIRQWTSEQATVGVDVPVASSVAVNLVFPGTARVVGTVFNADGSRASGAQVVGGTSLVTTDASGGFVIPAIATGFHRIEAGDPATGATGFVDISVGDPGGEVSVVIFLDGRATVTGSVLDQLGTGQVGVEVFLWFIVGGSEDSFVRTTTGEGGAFRFERIPFGSYVLRTAAANGDGGFSPTIDVVSTGISGPHPITYVGLGNVGGVVNDAGGNPVPSMVKLTHLGFGATGRIVPVEVELEANSPIGSSDPCGNACPACAGRFVAQPIPALGDYQLSVDAGVGGSVVLQDRILNAGEQNDHCLVLAESASLIGTVYLPDGNVAEDRDPPILVSFTSGGATHDTSVASDGTFAFSNLPSTGFRLAADDPATGNRAIKFGSLATGDEVVVDLELLGTGSVEVLVSDGSTDGQGNLIGLADAVVELTSGSPVASLLPPYPPLTTDSAGKVLFTGVPEGPFSVQAVPISGNDAGRRGGEILSDGDEQTLAVIVGIYGGVEGVAYEADGATPLPFAQVRLRDTTQNGGGNVAREDAFTTTGANGEFLFEFVPLTPTGAELHLELFDPKSGRIGFSDDTPPLRVEQQDTIVERDILLLGEGTVSGVVRRVSGDVAGGAKVELSSPFLVQPQGLSGRNVSFFGPGELTTTSNFFGVYSIPGVPAGAFDLLAEDIQGGGAMGGASGVVAVDDEEVAVDIFLEGRAEVSGIVFAANGENAVPFAVVEIERGSFTAQTTADATGFYLFPSVPLGDYSVTAFEQGGNDGGRNEGSTVQDGDTATTNVIMRGTGTVSGTAFVDQIQPDPTKFVGAISLTRPAMDFLDSNFDGSTDAAGEFEFTDIPVGDFSVTITDGGTLFGRAAGTLVGDGAAVTGLVVVLDPSGSVAGMVALGGNPVAGAIVTVSGENGEFHISTETNAAGEFTVSGVPLISAVVTAVDPASGGIGTATALTTAGGTDDVETIDLDAVLIGVESVSPADGASEQEIDLAPSGVVEITFNDLADHSTLTTNSIRLFADGQTIAGTLQTPVDLPGGKTSVDFVPAAPLPELRTVTVQVTQAVRDVFERPMPAPFESTFQTKDATAPEVESIRLIRGVFVVEFSESVSGGTITLEDIAGPTTIDAAAPVPSEGNQLWTVVPDDELADGINARVTVDGFTDFFNNALVGPVEKILPTGDDVGPTIVLIADARPDAQVANLYEASEGQTVTLEASAFDSDSEDILLVDFVAGGQILATDNEAPFEHRFIANLQAGSVTIDAIATDYAGNRGPAATVTVDIVANQAPVITVFDLDDNPFPVTGGSLGVQVSATDDVELADIEVSLLGINQIRRLAPGITQKDASFTFVIPKATVPGPGSNNLTVNALARDRKGVETAVSATTTLLDGARPTVEIVSLSGTVIADPGEVIPLVRVHAADAVGVAKVRLLEEGNPTPLEERNVSGTDVVEDFSYTVPAAAPTGERIVLVAEAEDAALNVGVSAGIGITVAGPPVVTLVSPVDQSTHTAGATFTIVATAPTELTDRVEFFVNGVLTGTDSVPNGQGEYRLSIVLPATSPSVIGVESVDISDARSPRAEAQIFLVTNAPPTAIFELRDLGGTPIPDGSPISIGETYILKANVPGNSSFDPEGQPLSYSWKVTAQPAVGSVTLSSTTSVQPSMQVNFGGPDPQSPLTIELTVSDGIDNSMPVDQSFTLAQPTATPTATNTGTATNTPLSTATPPPTSLPTSTPTPTPVDLEASGTVWCVGADPSTGPCANSTPISSLDAAVALAGTGDEIFVAQGTYTGSGAPVVTINKSIFVRGGFTSTDGWGTQTFGTTTLAADSGYPAISLAGPVEVVLDDLVLSGGGVSNPDGEVEVRSGTLAIDGGSSSGHFQIRSDGLLDIGIGSAFEDGVVVDGDGFAQTNDFNTSFEGAVTIDRLRLLPGSLLGAFLATDTLTIAVELDWQGGGFGGSSTPGGNIVLHADCQTTLSTSAEKDSFRQIVNHGNIAWQEGDIDLRGGASVFVNAADGVIRATGSVTIQKGSTSGVGGVFRNFGLFEVDAPGDLVVVSSTAGGFDIAFESSGIVSVANGELRLNGTLGPMAATAVFNVESGAVLQFGSNPNAYPAGVVFSGDGVFRIASNTTLDGDTTFKLLELAGGSFGGAGNITILDTMEWNGGFALGGTGTLTIGPLAVLNIDGAGGTKNISKPVLHNDGTILWTDTSGGIQLSNVIENDGVFEIATDDEIFSSSSGPAVIESSGVLRRSTTTGTACFGCFRDVTLANTGTIELETGVLELRDGNVDLPEVSVTLAGVVPGTDFGRLIVTNIVDFMDGLLTVNFVGSTPSVGDSYSIIAYGGRGATQFQRYQGLDLGGGLALQPVYDDVNGELRLVVVTTP